MPLRHFAGGVSQKTNLHGRNPQGLRPSRHRLDLDGVRFLMVARNQPNQTLDLKGVYHD